MAMALPHDHDVWNHSYDGIYSLYVQAKTGANFAFQTWSRQLISMLVLLLLPILAPIVIISTFLAGVFLAPLLCGVTAYYALFYLVSLRSITKMCDLSKPINKQYQEIIATPPNNIGPASHEESKNCEGAQKKDEEQAVEGRDTAERSSDVSTVEAKGEVTEYNVFHFDDRVRGQREGPEEAHTIKAATDEAVQGPSEDKHSVEDEEKFEELNGVEDELAGVPSVWEKLTVSEELENFSDKTVVEDNEVEDHPGGRSTAPINEEEGVDEKEAPYKKAVIEGKAASEVEDAVPEKPVGSLDPHHIEEEVEAHLTELSLEEPSAQENEPPIAEPEEVEQTETEASSEIVAEGPEEEQDAEAQSEPNQSEEKLEAKRPRSKARKRRQDKTGK